MMLQSFRGSHSARAYISCKHLDCETQINIAFYNCWIVQKIYHSLVPFQFSKMRTLRLWTYLLRVLSNFVMLCKFCFGGILHQYSSYGTELDQAERLINLTDHFDESGFNGRFRGCFQNFDKRIDCWHSTIEDFRNDSRLWNISSESKMGQLDCQYDIEAVHFRHERTLQLIAYKFIINQKNCASKLKIAGGTTFEIFGMNDLFLTACIYEDEFSGVYHATCRFTYAHIDKSLQSTFSEQATEIGRRVTGTFANHYDNEENILKSDRNFRGDNFSNARILSSQLQKWQCLALTIVVVHEHYDTYSELPPMIWERGYQYPYARTVISDNRSFCFDTVDEIGDLLNASNLPVTSRGGFFGNISLYTAIWHSNLLQPAARPMSSFQSFGNGSYYSGYLYLSSFKILTRFSSQSHDNKTIPSISSLKPELYSDRYVYDLVYFKGSGDEDVHTVQGDRIDFSFLATASRVMESTAHFDIHVIGASHARYLYDGLLEFTYGPTALRSDRKHGSESFLNIEYVYQELADDVVDDVYNMCQVARAEANPRRRKLVIHIGAWDFSVAGVRHFLREENSLPKLFSAFEQLIDGSLSCPGLTDIVYVLTVPYPVCYDNGNAKCLFDRGYRFNPGMAAANMHVVTFLTKLMSLPKSPKSPPIFISIVDAYSIIHPRLQFLEEAEITCLNHYMCPVGTDKLYVFTPGGKAVFDATLHALTSR